jgi:deoxyribodipyrimidine photo-lyase
VNVVWFKRDFRLKDHHPLAEAITAGEHVLLLAFIEPALKNDPHYDDRHWHFVRQSVTDMNRQLIPFHQRVFLLEADPEIVFEQIHRAFHIKTIYSNEETGIGVSFARDLRLKSWFESENIDWREFQNNGVVRGKKNRNNWSAQWMTFMETAQTKCDLSELVAPPKLPAEIAKTEVVDESPFEKSLFQTGGETAAWETLESFFDKRYQHYAKHISKPLLSRENCSRLSPYLAWGCLSVRQVYKRYKIESKQSNKKFQLDFFANRLHWHCHFIQKFEMEPRMEYETVNHGYKDLGRRDDPALHQLVVEGQTGFPLVDACLRCVAETGYINFRMRAMLVSFYTHHLWLNWQPFAHWLARQFLDFEPGIHYGQFQMQSAVTGINTVRIYNPIKQSQEHDAEAEFILKWVPELKKLPTPLVHEPWQCSAMEEMMYDFELGKDYPKPVVDIEETGKHARDVLWQKLKDPKVKQDANRVLKKHTNPGRKRMQ